MKKIFLVAAMAAVVLTSVNAQNKYKPENMSFSTELNYSPGGATTDGQFSLPDYGAKVRLHLNEKMAVRLKLGLNTSTDKDVTYYESPTDQKEYERNSKESITTFSIMPGFEYHFTKYERISPYVGGEIGLLTSTAKTKTDNTENDDKTETKRPGLGFGKCIYRCRCLSVQRPVFRIRTRIGLRLYELQKRNYHNCLRVDDHRNRRYYF